MGCASSISANVVSEPSQRKVDECPQLSVGRACAMAIVDDTTEVPGDLHQRLLQAAAQYKGRGNHTLVVGAWGKQRLRQRATPTSSARWPALCAGDVVRVIGLAENNKDGPKKFYLGRQGVIAVRKESGYQIRDFGGSDLLFEDIELEKVDRQGDTSNDFKNMPSEDFSWVKTIVAHGGDRSNSTLSLSSGHSQGAASNSSFVEL